MLTQWQNVKFFFVKPARKAKLISIFWRIQASVSLPHRDNILKKFDIFTRKGKNGWSYKCSIEAKTEDHAKELMLKQNSELQKHQLAVYPKR